MSQAAGHTSRSAPTAAMDEELEEARQDVIDADAKGLTPPAMPVGAALKTAENAQNQHVADEVKDAARLSYCCGAEAVAATPPVPPWPQFTVVETMTQVVAGTNYFFKVKVNAPSDPDEFVQLRVFVSLFGSPPQLVSMRKGPEGAEDLNYF